MMEVGIRELRTNLAAIMDEVDKGAVVTITHHGKPRATIRPVGHADAESPVERGIREGWLSVGPGFREPREDRRPRHVGQLPAGVSIDDVLADDRSTDR